jgi:hypothetical protein
MDAAFVLASTHQAALRREAAQHAVARRVRAARGDSRSLVAVLRTALVRATTQAVPVRAPHVAEPCPTC